MPTEAAPEITAPPVKRADPLTFAVLLAGTLAISTTFGMLLLLPLDIKERLGGNETDFGYVSAAGAITAAIAIGALIRFPRKLPPHVVLAITSAVYALGAFAVSFVHAWSWPLVVLGILLGTAWAMAYTSAPMVASELSSDASRARNIGYATGMVQVGFGLGPVIGDFLLRSGLSYNAVFQIAAALSLVAAIVVAPLHLRSPELSLRRETEGEPAIGAALVAIFRSRAVLPLIAVLLCACLFTTMNSFQTTFATSRDLSFNIFYVSYTLAVIFARFVLVRVLRDPGGPRVLVVASAGIVVTLVLFLVMGHNAFLYACVSALLGVTYGLTLPALQAGAVNVSAAENRPRILPLAGLVFEFAILAFPLAAGAIIVSAGYNALFAILLAFAVAVAAVSAAHARRGPLRGAGTTPLRDAETTP
jgi:MFS family permease